jgi:hypothetical protein
MKRKIIVVTLCVLMIAAMLPVATAVNTDSETDGCHKKLFTKTIIKGFILGPEKQGRTLTFFAVLVYYSSSSLLGETETGVLMMKRVLINGYFIGSIGKFYISGVIYSILP